MPRRLDVLHHWKVRKTITPAEFAAGCRVRDTWDRAEMAGLAVIRTDRPGPRSQYRDSGHALAVTSAREALVRMRWTVGEVDAKLVLGVLGEGKTLEDVANRWGLPGGKEHAARRIRFALTWLDVKKWGTASEMVEMPPRRDASA